MMIVVRQVNNEVSGSRKCEDRDEGQAQLELYAENVEEEEDRASTGAYFGTRRSKETR